MKKLKELIKDIHIKNNLKYLYTKNFLWRKRNEDRNCSPLFSS